MAISVLIEAMLPGGRGGGGTAGKPPPKDKAGLKEWIRNKLKAMSLLLGRLGMKAAEALPGITGAILSWILNKATNVVWLGIPKSMGISCRYWTTALHIMITK